MCFYKVEDYVFFIRKKIMYFYKIEDYVFLSESQIRNKIIKYKVTTLHYLPT